MEKTYFSSAVVRTPLYSVDFYHRLAAAGKDEFKQILADKVFLDAVHIASPELYRLIINTDPDRLFGHSKKDKKLRLSILRYAYRIATRSTPFGLFAGCAAVPISDQTRLVLDDLTQYKRQTRLDMQYLFSLANKISGLSFVRPYLKYYVNTSLYRLGPHYRYIECLYINNKRRFDLVSVDANEYIAQIIEFVSLGHGVSISDIAAVITREDISNADAAAFVEELINAQVLVSNLELGTTGDEMGARFILELTKIAEACRGNQEHAYAINTILSYLKEIQDCLSTLDKAAPGEEIQTYQLLTDKATAFKHPFVEQNLIQTDLITTYRSASLDQAVIADVRKGVEIVCRLKHIEKNSKLEKFIRSFEYRYESRMVPLVEALDIEAGIGYGSHIEEDRADISTFLDDIQTGGPAGPESQITLDSRMSSFWINKITDTISDKKQVLELTDADLDQFPAKSTPLTTTYSVITSLYREGDKGHIIDFKGVSGPTAALWLGRFAGLDKPIENLVNDIVAVEEEQHKDKIVAEITHLPEARLGNVLQRPAFRKYEIPYLANSTVSEDRQIPITDLLIGSRNGKIILFSKKHNKEVLPYLTNAHFYGTEKSLPIYHFLCDMQELNGQEGAALDVRNMHRFFKYIPRIQYKNIILKRASWKFTKEELAPLLNALEEELADLFRAFAQKHNLPSLFSIAQSDNELVINGNSLSSLQVFINEVKGLNVFIVSEVLFNDFLPLVTNERGEHFNNEVIFFFRKENEDKKMNSRPGRLVINEHNNTRRDFLPGSEWVYFNLYAGFKNADKILLSLGPLIKGLLAQNIIDKWFFIRYQDPRLHLRVRFHLAENATHKQLHDTIYPAVAALKEQQLIWRATVDTYRRELERYGFRTIEPIETIFFYDSMMCLELIKYFEETGEETLKWLAGLYSAGSYLDLFGLSMEEKAFNTNSISAQFAAEFSATEMTNKSIDKKYRMYKDRITAILDGGAAEKYESGFINIIDRRNDLISTTISSLDAGEYNFKTAFFDSLIHMSINRLFRSRQRMYEFVIYNFLKKNYASAIARRSIPALGVADHK